MAVTESMPELLRPLFWDVDFNSLSWEKHQDFIAQRVLQSGSWEDVCWLRRSRGDEWLRGWLLRRKGAQLDARRLRFWQVVLHLPARSVDCWLSLAHDDPWAKRLGK